MSITTTICAYNAEKTIGRAITSALSAGDNPILLVDDFSVDNTVTIAKNLAGDRLRVVSPKEKLGIGNARQTALDSLETPYALWLDSDDELLPGRPERMTQALASTNADLVYDSGFLVGMYDYNLELSIPGFLRFGDNYLRLLERNWLPGLWGGFKTESARNIGYDKSFYNSEDYDFLIRSLLNGHSLHFLDQVGYKYHHSKTSLSRNIREALHFTKSANAKHSPMRYITLLDHSKLSAAEQLYTASTAMLMAGHYQELIELSDMSQASHGIIEPYKLPAADLIIHLRATAFLLMRDTKKALYEIKTLSNKSPEMLNCEGIALKLSGKKRLAINAFQAALELKPEYFDAQKNLETIDQSDCFRVTHLPFRPITSRSDYS